MVEQIFRIPASSYTLSKNNEIDVTNASNMYHNTDNNTYATITTTKKDTTARYIYVNGFNWSSAEAEITAAGGYISWIDFALRARVSSLSTGTTTALIPGIYDGTASLRIPALDPLSSSDNIITFETPWYDWPEFENYDLGIRVTIQRSNKNTQGYLYIYGAEMTIHAMMPEQEKFWVGRNGIATPVKTVWRAVNGSLVEVNPTTLDRNIKYVLK